MKNYKINVKNICEFKKGFSSKKWLIIDHAKNKYILKKIDYLKYNNILFALDIQNKINNIAPKIIETKNNCLFYIENENLFYLTEYLENDEYIIDAYKLGYFLGMLHIQLSKIKYDREINFIKCIDNSNKIENLFNNCTDKYIKKILQYKKKILSINELDYDLSKLSLQIIHGDFYIDNIIFSNNEIKIVDFDQCCTFYSEYEVLRGFFISLYKESQQDENLNLLKKYITGYKCFVKHINGDNTYKLYLSILANSLSGICGKKIDLNFATKRYEILKFLVCNKKQIIDILNNV